MNELQGSAVVVAVQDKQPISKLYIGIKNNPMALVTQNDEEITWLASTKDILIKGLKGLDNADIDYDDGLTDEKPTETSDAKIDIIRREMKERIDKVEDEVDTVDDEPEVEETKGLMARRV